MRLVGAHGDCGSGIVQVCLEDEEVRVCGDGWGQMETAVACTQLGYSPTGMLLKVVEFGESKGYT